jgi:hypothetical protein
MPITREFQRARFTIDSLPNRIFEGFTDGDTWNGWACPYFTHDIAITILQAARDNGYEWAYEAEIDTFLAKHRDDGNDFEPERFEGIRVTVDEKDLVVYGIGTYTWTWMQSP